MVVKNRVLSCWRSPLLSENESYKNGSGWSAFPPKREAIHILGFEIQSHCGNYLPGHSPRTNADHTRQTDVAVCQYTFTHSNRWEIDCPEITGCNLPAPLIPQKSRTSSAEHSSGISVIWKQLCVASKMIIYARDNYTWLYVHHWYSK